MKINFIIVLSISILNNLVAQHPGCLSGVPPASSFVPLLDNEFKKELDDQSIGNIITLSGGYHCLEDASVNNITTLDISNSTHNITDLAGIEAFAALEELFCQNNDIINLDLSQNANMTDLKGWNNKFSNILDLTGSDQWTYVNVNNNENLSQIDFATGDDAPAGLTHLIFYECDVSSITGLSHLTALKKFNAAENNLSNFDATYHSSLENLTINNNLNLNSLVFDNTNSSLTRISTQNCNLSSLDVSDLTNLEMLNCDGNSISNLDLSSSIEELFCRTNSITNLDVTGITNLQKLAANNNSNLGTIDLSNNTSLNFLSLYNCGLYQLNLYNNTALNDIDIRSNSSLNCVIVTSSQANNYHSGGASGYDVEPSVPYNSLFKTYCNTYKKGHGVTISKTNNFNFYPNPATNQININSDYDIDKAYVIDSKGVKLDLVIGNENVLDFSNVKTGLNKLILEFTNGEIEIQSIVKNQ